MNKNKLCFLLIIFLLLVLCTASSSFAIKLSGDGLGHALGYDSKGFYNYGPELSSSDLPLLEDLTLTAWTRIGQKNYKGTDYPDGLAGGITLHQTDGIGVKGVDLKNDGTFDKYGGSDPLSGDGAHQDEAIIFNYLTPVSLDTISLDIINTKWSKEKKDGSIESKDVNLEIMLSTGESLDLFNDQMVWTEYGLNSEYGIAQLVFDDLFADLIDDAVVVVVSTVSEGPVHIHSQAFEQIGTEQQLEGVLG